jgi:ribose transport system ATP-binding protein
MVVLRDGVVAGERVVAQTTPEETILLIVGREPSQVFRRPAEREGRPRLGFAGACVGAVGPIEASIHAGEIVGLVGLRGAGQEAVSRALFGVEPLTSGEIRIDGSAVRINSPRRAMELGVNLVCADRVGESVVPGLSVRENFYLNPLAAGRGKTSWITPRHEGRASRRLGETVGLRPNDPSLAIELLSGGNQQKVVVGRWLHLKSKIYVFEDPTAGVDVGAKAEIYKLFDVALREGAAILIVSTDFEEIAKVCHRALVFDRGQVVSELHADDLSISNLLGAASANIERSRAVAH